jgi:hypothetical protein
MDNKHIVVNMQRSFQCLSVVARESRKLVSSWPTETARTPKGRHKGGRKGGVATATMRQKKEKESSKARQP